MDYPLLIPDHAIVQHVYSRVFVFTRVTGHIRLDGNVWTYLFICDPFLGAEKSGYKSGLAVMTMNRVSDWVSECINEQSSREHLRNLEKDGFGVVVRVLRNIKSTWKLALSEFETFLEDIVSG